MRAMTVLKRDVASKKFTEESLLVKLPFCEQGGIKSTPFVSIC